MRLVGVLVSIAIVALLVWLWLTYGVGSSGTAGGVSAPATRPTELRQQAESVECRNNLSQIRAAIQMRQTAEETYPTSLNELGLPTEMLRCPVSGQPYAYDANTGQVRCATPGHGGY